MTPPPKLAGLVIVAALAAVTGRVMNAERVYEPSLSPVEPERAAATVLVPLAASSPLDVIALTAATQPAVDRLEERSPPRPWPRTRPYPMPSFGSNDRSRWCAVRAVVDHGTFVIGERIHNADGTYRDVGIVAEDGYAGIDIVKHPETHQFYSSKPPLLTGILAAEYWAVKHALGVTITSHRWLVMRLMVWLTNALPFALYLAVLARVVDRLTASEWARMVILIAAAFGTFVSTFAVTLNNHGPAAFAALFAVAPLLTRGEMEWRGRDLALSGFNAGLAACFDLPAAALAAGLFAAALLVARGRAVVWFLPALLLPVAAMLALNYVSLGQLRPAYTEFGGPWYEYPGSHWLKRKVPAGVVVAGIDFAHTQESRGTYAFHLLLGHHGVFSLTPLWLLSVVGAVAGLARPGERGGRYRWFCLLTLGVTAAVAAFFTCVTSTRNYGGWTSGPRWFFWLTPLLLFTMPPALDVLERSRLGRGVCYVALGVSVVSASYPVANPWRHPWIYVLMDGAGWKGY